MHIHPNKISRTLERFILLQYSNMLYTIDEDQNLNYYREQYRGEPSVDIATLNAVLSLILIRSLTSHNYVPKHRDTSQFFAGLSCLLTYILVTFQTNYLINNLPSSFANFIKRSNKSAEHVIKNKTSHGALETLYTHGYRHPAPNNTEGNPLWIFCKPAPSSPHL